MHWRRRLRINSHGVSIAAEVNAAFAVNAEQVDSTNLAPKRRNRARGVQMTDQQQEFKPLSHDELVALAGEELPERAAMSLINANIAIPINAAVAANVLSDNATSAADAAQSGPLGQIN